MHIFLKPTEHGLTVFAEDFCVEVTTHETFLNYHQLLVNMDKPNVLPRVSRFPRFL